MGPDVGPAVNVCYSTYLAEFKKRIKSLHLKGMKASLGALDKSYYYLRHPGGRAELDRIVSASSEQLGLHLSQGERDTSHAIFSTIRNRALVLMIEASLLYSSGRFQNKNCSRMHLVDTLWLAEQVVTMAFANRAIEKVSTLGIESLQILESGGVHIKQSEKFEKQGLRLHRLYSIENRDIVSSIPQGSNVADLIENCKRFDQLYIKEKGYSLTDVANLLKYLITGMKACFKRGTPRYVCQIRKSDLIGLVVKNSRLPRVAVERILRDMVLTSGKLRNVSFPEWHFPRETTLLVKPVLAFKVGDELTVCFSELLVSSAFGLLLSYPLGMKDKTHGNKEAEKYKRELTEAFEREVANRFSRHGFDTYLNINTRKHIGEIDVLAYHREKSVVVIAECKAPKARLDVASMLFQIEEVEKWERKIRRKASFVRDNFQSIHGFNDFQPPDAVISVLVTQRPWATIFPESFDVVHLIELDSWIDKIPN